MTLNEVEERIERIRDVQKNDAVAHGLEDDLYLDVLTELAKQGNVLAAAAIASQEIEFGRWCEPDPLPKPPRKIAETDTEIVYDTGTKISKTRKRRSKA